MKGEAAFAPEVSKYGGIVSVDRSPGPVAPALAELSLAGGYPLDPGHACHCMARCPVVTGSFDVLFFKQARVGTAGTFSRNDRVLILRTTVS